VFRDPSGLSPYVVHNPLLFVDATPGGLNPTFTEGQVFTGKDRWFLWQMSQYGPGFSWHKVWLWTTRSIKC
jgi:hypothetical protein